MKRVILILFAVFVSTYSKAQLSKGSNFVNANLNFNYNPSTGSSDGTGTIQSTTDNHSNSYSSTLNYGRFVKDNLAIYIGPTITHSEYGSSNFNANSDTTYSKGSYNNSSTQIGGMIGVKKFYPVWQQKFFLTVNSALNIGYVHSTTDQENSQLNTNYYYESLSHNDNKGIASSFNVGLGAYYFMSKYWAFSAAINLLAINYTHTSGTSSNTSFNSNSTPQYNATNLNTKNDQLNGQFLPTFNPFGMSWGVSCFF